MAKYRDDFVRTGYINFTIQKTNLAKIIVENPILLAHSKENFNEKFEFKTQISLFNKQIRLPIEWFEIKGNAMFTVRHA